MINPYPEATLRERREKMKKLITAGILILAACGSSPSESNVIQNGSWLGTAFDSTDVTFTVNGDSLQNMVFQVTYDMTSRPDTTVTWSCNTDITDDQFQYEVINGLNEWEFGLSMAGTFTPPDHVSGDITTWVVFTEGGGTETDTLETSWSAAPE
jgi:hypothetical protein